MLDQRHGRRVSSGAAQAQQNTRHDKPVKVLGEYTDNTRQQDNQKTKKVNPGRAEDVAKTAHQGLADGRGEIKGYDERVLRSL